MKIFPRYFKFTILSLFLVVFTLWVLFSNPISYFLDSTIAFLIQRPSYNEFNSIIISSSTSQNKSLMSLNTIKNNDTIISCNRIVARTNETEYHVQYYSLINNDTTRSSVLKLTGNYVIPGLID